MREIAAIDANVLMVGVDYRIAYIYPDQEREMVNQIEYIEFIQKQSI